jgi:flagellin
MLSLINNLSALTAQNNLSNANNALNTSLQRLSSGLRINSGADDPAGLVISQIQQAQMSGLQTAISNTSTDINVAQTANGGLNEINALLVQIRGLAVAAANSGANDPNMLAADQAQIANALQTITRIATSTQYGKEQLLDGSHASTATISSNALTGGSGTVSASATADTASGTYKVNITSLAARAAATGTVDISTSPVVGAGQTETLTINGIQIQLNGGATGLDSTGAIEAINQQSSQTGVTASLDTTGKYIVLTANAYGKAGNNYTIADSGVQGTVMSGMTAGVGLGLQGVTFQNGADVVGTITDPNGKNVNVIASGNVLTASNGLTVTTDPTATTATGEIDVLVSNNSLTFQIGANAGQTASLAIQNMQANALGIGVANNSGITNLSLIDVTNAKQSFSDILNVIDKAISDVSNLAGALGAFQDNTLQATAANLQTSLQNTTAANSTIRDTNFAQESATYAQDQVLVQAGTQVLKNANQLPQLALALLQ